jgi:4-alpha-glucanotransferase
MSFERASGVLLHPTSLPSDHGIGDLGPNAFHFVDLIANAKQTYWQILPLGPTGWGDSPYSSYSAFAGNTLLISPEQMLADRFLDELPAAVGSADRVDYGAVYESKTAMLGQAFSKWDGAETDEFKEFAEDNAFWLDDYALYRAIKLSHGQKPWFEWDDALKLRDPAALERASTDLSEGILAEKFSQFLFFKQWSALKAHANSNGVRIVGDIPIFVALDSADVWRHREQFKLNEDGSARVVSGVPPDYFSKTGQLWGNPIYDWDAMRDDGFTWWIERTRQMMKTADVIRVDHFKGFDSAWEVPGGDSTAEHGEWVEARGEELFRALSEAFGSPLPFWAEDLGFMTPEAYQLRDDFGFPGMRILQFAFGGDARNEALPHNYINNSIVYTGTHDNDTVVGWWNSLPEDDPARAYCMKYLKTEGSEINWDLIRAAWASVADVAIVPLQDVLGLDNEARMNLPASTDGNWKWRFRDGDMTEEIVTRLGEMTEVYGRSR